MFLFIITDARVIMNISLKNPKTILIILFLIFTLFFFLQRSLYHPYSVNQNYVYDFSKSNAIITSLHKNGNTFSVSPNVSLGHSHFIEVNLESNILGHYLRPSIIIKTPTDSFVQNFEYGAQGIRYLNISSATPTTHFTLTTKHITIKNKISSLISFKDQKIRKAKILILSPHPDDAEIAAYGFYSSYPNSHIITITAGDAGKFHYDEIYQDKKNHYLKKGQLRTWNSLTVPLLAGIHSDHILNFGFFDNTLAPMYLDPTQKTSGQYTESSNINLFRKQNISHFKDSLVSNTTWNSLIENLSIMLRNIKPDIIISPYPALDSHLDHKLTSVALFEALHKNEVQQGELYLYTNHLIQDENYPYGKEGGTISLPPSFQNFHFDALYSHPLSKQKQQDKLIALEAMNVLRQDTEWRTLKGSFKKLFQTISYFFSNEYGDYFNRSVRSNELFYRININKISNEKIRTQITGILPNQTLSIVQNGVR